ncbi:hypothetical protein [Brevibacillus laterosporus]|uniref:hypothetical protein n=1 Tax=Brevibacillus laterosporus TaxID=1465 RepID=UPI001443D545|nr:hypothetical protein [Brevibacillus laterosporus]NKQ22776.1 hypothetical protein [Brevibacillus laterosporus]WNX33770.1 hypothetical protein RWW94_24545 [Brevibacillus laterosporus]
MKKNKAKMYKVDTLEERLERFDKKIKEQDRKIQEKVNKLYREATRIKINTLSLERFYSR